MGAAASYIHQKHPSTDISGDGLPRPTRRVPVTFPRGNRAIPGGRRKKTAEDIEIQQLARQHGPTAINALVKIATKGKSESAQVAAALALLDRGYGKPTQPVENDVNRVSYRISAVPLTVEEWDHSVYCCC
jgi:hypothetical protein